MIIEYMLIAGLGGFAGTCGRYLTGVAGKKLFGDKYPAGTFAVNVIGCFIIGIFVGLWTRHDMSPLVNALLISGFCGGFTTFSSFSHDSFAMIQKGEWWKFICYIVPSVGLGLLMVWLGIKTFTYTKYNQHPFLHIHLAGRGVDFVLEFFAGEDNLPLHIFGMLSKKTVNS